MNKKGKIARPIYELFKNSFENYKINSNTIPPVNCGRYIDKTYEEFVSKYGVRRLD